MELIQEAIQLVLASNISSKALIVNKLQQVSSMVHQKDIKIKDLEHQVKALAKLNNNNAPNIYN